MYFFFFLFFFSSLVLVPTRCCDFIDPSYSNVRGFSPARRSSNRSNGSIRGSNGRYPLLILSPPATNDQLAALTEMGRNMTQMSLLSIGKSRSGTSSAGSQFLTALNPLTPLFHDFDHLTKLICPGESLGVGVVSSLSLTPDLLSLSSLVNIDNFRKKTLELTYPYDDDDSALRSLSSDAIVGLATLNFATYHDKCVGILTF